MSAFDISNISFPERWLVLRFYVFNKKSNLRVYFNYLFLTDKLKKLNYDCENFIMAYEKLMAVF